MQKKVTISDIAKATGYGRATVSYVLGGKDLNRISEPTQKIIREAAKKMNYRPNPVARCLRSGESRLIGVIFDKDDTSFRMDMLMGVENVLTENGYLLVFCHLHSREEIAAKTARLLEHFMDGIVMRSLLWDEVVPAGTALLPESLPVVRLATPDHHDYPTVNVSTKEIVRLALQYLYDMGHRNIAISPTLPEERQDFLRSFCGELGIPQPILLKPGSPQEFLTQMLALGKRATALIAEDSEATKLLFWAKQQGVNIPERFSVLGNDGLECGQYSSPTLTTIAQPQVEQGETAARLLMEWLKSGKRPQSNVLMPFLLERHSVRKIG